MLPQTLYLILITLALFILMFTLVPPRRGPGFFPFGFWMGLIPACIILWLGNYYLRLFRFRGDPTLFGIPILLSICWIPLAILFARFYPRDGSPLVKIGYIILFATTSVIGQIILFWLGIWVNIHWNPLATFGLAIGTHLMMTWYYEAKYRQRLK